MTTFFVETHAHRSPINLSWVWALKSFKIRNGSILRINPNSKYIAGLSLEILSGPKPKIKPELIFSIKIHFNLIK